MSLGFYRKGRNYELFIRKVYNCKKGKRHGADESLMVNLFLMELNQEYAKNQRIPKTRQFFKVKLYLERALAKLYKRKKYNNSFNHFMPLILELSRAKSPDDLTKIVNRGFIKIIEIENELRRSA